MIDAELLIYTLLMAGAPEGTTVLPETDSETLGDLPIWTFYTIGDGQTANGPGMYDVALELSVFAEGIDAAKGGATILYDLVHSWDTNPASAVVPDVGWVQSVDDNSLFSRVAAPELTGSNVSQYAGSFALALRK